MTPIQQALAVFGMGVREAYYQHGVWFESNPRRQRWYGCVECTNVVRFTCDTGRRLPRPPELPF